MSTVQFFCDENVPEQLADAVVAKEPAIVIGQVGQAPAPPKQTPDPELLRYAEANQLLFLTRDKKTMPGHVAQHLSSGRHTWGVFLLRRSASIADLVDAIILIWSASTAEEWQDQINWLP